jgi:type II secretory pathway pseudopilin PulG
MVVLVVLNIAVATAVQIWSKVIQRENEQELIFRGLQYAEAIRVFQRRFDRPPTTLEELMEVRPRVIRQLWTDPLSPSGAWEPILAGSGTDVTTLGQGNAPGAGGSLGQGSGGQGPGRQGRAEEGAGGLGRERRAGSGRTRPGESGGRSGLGQSQAGGFGAASGTGEQLSRAFDEAAGFGSQAESSSFGSSARETQIGPIEGVRPTASGSAMKHFLGRSDYGSWEFRASMLAEPRVSPEGVPLTPRIDPDALGRPFPDWLTGVPGAEPHPTDEGDGSGPTDEGAAPSEDPLDDEGWEDEGWEDEGWEDEGWEDEGAVEDGL